MFAPLTKPDFGKTCEDARVYCRPACFVDRPHELDDDCLRIADTLVWFAAWHVSLRDTDEVRSAIVPVPELDAWIAANSLISLAAPLPIRSVVSSGFGSSPVPAVGDAAPLAAGGAWVGAAGDGVAAEVQAASANPRTATVPRRSEELRGRTL